jgi:hypothetical protein
VYAGKEGGGKSSISTYFSFSIALYSILIATARSPTASPVITASSAQLLRCLSWLITGDATAEEFELQLLIGLTLAGSVRADSGEPNEHK